MGVRWLIGDAQDEFQGIEGEEVIAVSIDVNEVAHQGTRPYSNPFIATKHQPSFHKTRPWNTLELPAVGFRSEQTDAYEKIVANNLCLHLVSKRRDPDAPRFIDAALEQDLGLVSLRAFWKECGTRPSCEDTAEHRRGFFVPQAPHIGIRTAMTMAQVKAGKRIDRYHAATFTGNPASGTIGDSIAGMALNIGALRCPRLLFTDETQAWEDQEAESQNK
ncbi:hypothetical protein BCR34DRAFT_665978 [Clohesyomyces aquaticus]|uniref:Uncharacterized protein n=1 Tax=Clohesyomyces aquaticus TaxID=1231657 RepID=A0A1Y1ZEM4_9PLEO|nr:hypothetical protein BCR34DRAFT_665978 [Clohesyomyces aquaticus]